MTLIFIHSHNYSRELEVFKHNLNKYLARTVWEKLEQLNCMNFKVLIKPGSFYASGSQRLETSRASPISFKGFSRSILYYNYTKMLFVFSLFDTCTDGAKLVMGFIAVYAGALARMVVAPKCRNHCILYHYQLLERRSRGRNQFYLRMSLKQLKLLIIISTNEYTSFKHFV